MKVFPMLLADAAPQTCPEFPFLLGNRRNRHGMNSWLNELPGLHPSGKRNVVFVHPDDAAALDIGDGDTVRVTSVVG
jgi:formate dehydrogenase